MRPITLEWSTAETKFYASWRHIDLLRWMEFPTDDLTAVIKNSLHSLVEESSRSRAFVEKQAEDFYSDDEYGSWEDFSDSEDDAPIDNANGYGRLREVAWYGNVSGLQDLLQREDLNVDQVLHRDGLAALHLACLNGRMELVRYLKEIGADVNVRAQPDGCTPLKYATANHTLDIMQFLIDNGANVEMRGYEGRTPLHAACWTSQLKAIEFLLEKGADIEAKDLHGKTPLQLAFSTDSLEVAKLLVEKGADINCKDHDQWTPFRRA